MSKQASIRFDEDLLRRADAAAKRNHESRSDLIQTAVELYLDGEEEQYRQIPDTVKDCVAFIMQIILTGKPERDWDIIKEEVVNLWKLMQS